MKIKSLILTLGGLIMLSGCSSHSINQYKETTPKIDLEQYFTGPIKAWGIVQDRSGKVTRRFDIDLIGSWDGDTGTLEEDFHYYDGEKQRRVWTIKRTGEKVYEGTADDILHKATGEQEGNAVRWAYRMDLPVGGKTYRLTFDDWMYQMNDGVLINRSYIKKFGITFAELTIFMQKQDK